MRFNLIVGREMFPRIETKQFRYYQDSFLIPKNWDDDFGTGSRGLDGIEAVGGFPYSCGDSNPRGGLKMYLGGWGSWDSRWIGWSSDMRECPAQEFVVPADRSAEIDFYDGTYRTGYTATNWNDPTRPVSAKILRTFVKLEPRDGVLEGGELCFDRQHKSTLMVEFCLSKGSRFMNFEHFKKDFVVNETSEGLPLEDRPHPTLEIEKVVEQLEKTKEETFMEALAKL